MLFRKKSDIANQEYQEVLDRLKYSQSHPSISIELDTKHPWVKGIQIYF